ncbi:alkaline phosphatase family protein [Saccharopolyspora sp. K220]|uniref:alkaline phosphatase D family protein n=1 Tax=Saccharopolyspora soli TaxID=2926618 RepID=UPI001F578292|nr:alkaline phosphatase D family protein [Saccharopolyspora soli]MCI2418196.1 alkaline phosphatase family protein [Saccharopolyspora soli]
MTELVLGPLLRYVDNTRATVWVETDGPCTVSVLDASARTFQVGGHHYALVIVRDLDTTAPYEVRLDERVVWPEPGSPPSWIRPVPRSAKLRLLFGSCHFDRPEDARLRNALGPDALTAYGAQLARTPESDWPDALLLLGDQVYADETTPELQRVLRARRDVRRPPGTEVADFEEYTLLYRQAWRDAGIRWLLSTVPTMMIFDDHDVRDDWNTSREWRVRMAREPWWPERVLGGLISYWIYQHIGNLSPDELDRDETYQQVLAAGRSGDALPVLREHAARADTERDGEKGARWSYYRDLGPARLVVLDTRCGRILETAERAMLSDGDFRWLRKTADSDREHLVLASSLPWLLPHAVHHIQSWNELACTDLGRLPKLAETLRQFGDLEHWAAFRTSFDRLTALIRDRADAASAPATISVLSGDVHHSYLAEAEFTRPTRSRVLQLTCSPLHNPAPRVLRGPLRAAWTAPLAGLFRRLAERAGVAPLPVEWRKSAGPFFGNAIGELDFDGPRAEVRLLEAASERRLTTVCHEQLS